MKRLVESITYNFGWKVLSLTVAIAAWFLVVNIENPQDIRRVPMLLRVEGEDALRQNNILLLNADDLKATYITLTLRGRRSIINQAFNDRSELYAFIDLSPIDISRTTEFNRRLPIRVIYGTTSQYYEVSSSSQTEVQVILDRYVSRSFPVIIDKQGDVMPGYISSDPVASPMNIEISGALSLIDTIAEVRTTVEVGEATEPIEAVGYVEVFNVDGANISDLFTLNTKEVNISVDVSTFARIPVSAPVITGEAASGYRVISVHVAPREIEVEGHPADIRALSAIRLVSLDITGINRTRIETYDILAYLDGTNLNIREGSETQVRVTVSVEREITKEILIPVDQIEIRGATGAVSIQPSEAVRLEVQGIAAEIVEFENSYLISYVDVAFLEPGIYQLEVRLQTPYGIIQTGTEPIEVIIEEAEAVEDVEYNIYGTE